MAIDSHHLLLNRELMMMNTTMEQTYGGYQTGYGVVSVTDAPPPPLLNMYGCDTIPTTTYNNYGVDASPNLDVCDNFFPLTTRKRSRDSRSDYYNNNHLLLPLHQNPRSSSSSCVTATNTTTTTTTPFSFLGQDIDISSHIIQQQHEIDRFVSLHMERVRFEIEEKRKKQARTIMEAIEHGLVKRLRVKEEERDRIEKINHALEERVKSLSIENQIWRDLAQTNEAAANNLRTNLEQVLAQVNVLPGAGLDNVNENENDDEDDAQSCCGSSSGDEETVRRTVAKEAYDKTAKRRMCRNCGEEESRVLLLPCRHLCLCGICGSSVHTCPICRSSKNASVHVNMSS